MILTTSGALEHTHFGYSKLVKAGQPIETKEKRQQHEERQANSLVNANQTCR